MKSLTHTPFIIFSGEKSNLSLETNRGITEHIKRMLQIYDIPFKEIEGVYDGVPEKSFLIVGDVTARNVVGRIALAHEQESILFVDQFRNTELHFLDGSAVINLGDWTEVSEEEAKKTEAFSKDISTGKYYICK